MRNRFLATLAFGATIAFAGIPASSAAGISVTAKGPTTATPDAIVSYVVTVADNAGGPIANGQVVATIPVGMTFVSGQSSADYGTLNCYQQGNLAVCPVAIFHYTHSATIRFTFKVTQCPLNASFQASFSGLLGQRGGGNYRIPVNGTSNMVVTTTAANACPVPKNPSLTLTKTVDKTVAQRGDFIAYTLTIKNTGNGVAKNARIDDYSEIAIARGAVFVPEQSTGCSVAGNITRCGGYDLQPGEARTFRQVFRVSQTAACAASIPNTAGAAADNATPVYTPVVTTTVQCPAPTTDLSVIKAGPSTVQAGNAVIYTLAVTNNGQTTVPSYTVTDAVPQNLTYSPYGTDIVSCSLQGANVVCTGANLAPGQTRTFTVAFMTKTVTDGNDPFCRSSIQNTARVSSSIQDTNATNNVSTVQTGVTCPPTNTAITAQKTGPSTVAQNGTISYTLRVTNNGQIAANSVRVRDTFQNGLQYAAEMSDPSCIATGGQVECYSFNLPAGQSKSFVLTFSVGSVVACNATITNSFVAISQNAPSVTSNQVSTTVTCQPANISVVKTAQQPTAAPGDRVSYRIDVRNNGEQTANDVVLTDQIPNGLVYQSSANTCYLNGTTISCPLGSLARGETKSVTLNFIIASDAQCDLVTVNNAAVTFAGNPAPVISNNAFVNVRCAPPQLRITKSTPQVIVNPNGLIYYAIRIENVGQSAAQNVVLSDTIPAGTTFQSSDSGCTSNGSTVSCYLNSIPPNQGRTVNMVFQVRNTAACEQVVTNTARVEATSIAPISSNPVSTTVKCNPPTLTITKTPQQNEVSKNGTIGYAILVTNTGNSPAANVVVTDEVPAGLTFQSSDSGCVQNNTNVVCNLDALPVSQSRTVNLMFRVNDTAACGPLLNKAHVRATNLDQVTSTPAIVTVRCASPVLQVEKEALRPNINQNETITYRIRVINHTQTVAQNVVMTDQVPAGLVYQSSDANCSLQGTNVVCQLGTLNGVETRTINLTFAPAANVQCNVPISNVARAVGTGVAEVVSQPANVTVNCQPARLTVTKAVQQTTVQRGGNISYSIVVTNNGQSVANSVQLGDLFPVGTSYVSSDNNCAVSGMGLLCNLGNLTVGASRTIALTLRVNDTAQCNANVTNKALVQATGIGTIESNMVSTMVQCQPAQLSITKQTSQTTVARGGTLNFGITVTNNGQSAAQNVLVTDQIPAGLSFLSSTDNV